MKYSIIINDAFVKQISDEFRIVKSTASLKSEKDAGYLFTDFDDVIDFESGQDYMSIIGNMANKSKKLGIAIAYLVLTWQLIMMLIYYSTHLLIQQLHHYTKNQDFPAFQNHKARRLLARIHRFSF